MSPEIRSETDEKRSQRTRNYEIEKDETKLDHASNMIGLRFCITLGN